MDDFPNRYTTICTATMTTISPLNTASTFAPLYNTSATKTTSTTPLNSIATEQSSTTVTLGQPAVVTPVYTIAPQIYTPPVWENSSEDAVSSLMAFNFSSYSGAQRFNGLGAALLNQLGVGGNDFSQSVLAPDANSSPATIALSQSELHGSAANQMTLDVTLASGATVEISLDSDTNGLGVQVKVANGSLSGSDQKALGSLSTAFQSAIDGLTQIPPKLDLGGLMQVDSSAISALSFHASVQTGNSTQTVDLRSDSQQRSLSVNGPDGKIALNVDMADVQFIGNAQQQASAIKSYMQQFQSEAARGHANASFMSMFESAFTALNSNYNVSTPSNAASAILASLPGAAQSVLTGLADFTASVEQTPLASNPFQPSEVDTFSYQVSQTTDVEHADTLNLSVTQRQNSQLHASFHQALPGADELHLTMSKNSQSYDYYQINDSASSEAQVAYQKGALVKATLNHSASESTRKREYVKGNLVQDTTTPDSESWSKSFLKLLDDAQLGSLYAGSQAVARAQPTLQAINRLVVLQANVGEIESTRNS
jgi:hypothetical protein